MGMTYKALDLRTKRFVAVKQLHLSRMQEWKTLEMFEREAKTLQQLNHSRVPSYIDYFSLETSSSGKQFLLVQEYVEGKTLKRMIEEGWRGSETEILDIFLDLVDILVSLHSVHPPVIHRDINPKNIIISPDHDVFPELNDIYLVDFGAVQDRIRTTFLGGTTIVGTFGYIPFEQFNGQAVPASDYYALGATLLYMLTHRHPSEFPTDDLKPHFEPFLHSSAVMTRLLNGLLEPAAKKRIASPEQIGEIFAESFVEPIEQFSTPSKPPKTWIEKIVEGPHNQIFFRIPKQKIGFVLTRTILQLTPKWLQVSEEILGVSGGKSRRIPLPEIHPSDITWYFEKGKRSKGKSVLGVNHAGETLEIGFHLSKAEIDWLTQEINEYIWMIKNQLPVTEQEPDRFEDISQDSQETPEKLVKPSGTHIKKTVKKHHHVRFRIPETISRDDMVDMSVTFVFCLVFAGALTAAALYMIHASGAGWIIGAIIFLISGFFWLFGLGLFLTGIFRLFGRTMIQLSPEWIYISRKCFGIGWTQHIPTADIQPNDVIRYFHKNRLLLGINYAGNTSKIGVGLSQEEIEWLIQEITGYITKFAQPIPKSQLESEPEVDLEMK